MHIKTFGATREDPHSLAPIQLETTNLERDLASFKRGDGSHLLLAVLGSVVAMAGLLLWMNGNDDQRAYTTAARQLASLYAQPELKLEQCALLQPQGSQQLLRGAIDAASRTYGKAYEQQLAVCSRALVKLERKLSGVDAPMGMQHRLDGLRYAANAFNRAIGRYRSYLYDLSRAYDSAAASLYIDNVVTAWGDYELQRRNTFDALRAGAPTR